uniref:DUF3017 domain-containing protein n=1 Tax=uncultured Nocardioidaceae bacterium TaxID=253824 RepID=A0A6J4M5M4_9ACTN|nr:MAG: hypothetical protein AVDCRST_MAG46-2573 [uncultured Nocardioidaceae bacterium]
MTRARRFQPGTVAYVAVAVAVLVGLALVALGAWQAGMTVAGAAMAAASVARALLPERLAGLLRVRRRTSDVVLMLGFGVALITLAAAIPARAG